MSKSRLQREKAKHRTGLLKRLTRANSWHSGHKANRHKMFSDEFVELANRLKMGSFR